MLKQVYQFLAETALAMLSLEDLEQLRGDLGGHLGNCLLVELRKSLEGLDRQVHHLLLTMLQEVEQVIKDSLKLLRYLLHIILTDLSCIPHKSSGGDKLY